MSAPGPTARLREDCLAVFRAAVAEADPARAVRTHLRRQGGRLEIAGEVFPHQPPRIRAVAFGKAASAMASALEEVLPAEIFPGPGVAVTSKGSGRPLSRFRVIEASHPLPDAAGVEGARAVAQALQGAQERDLSLVLISGGGSALLPAPAPGISLEDKVAATRLLLESGADIHELNTVRKHLSSLKGGGLARAGRPALLRGLILSDVIGDDLSVIASGPLSPDPTTFAQALEVLARRGLLERVPPAVRERLARGLRGEIEETPKPGDPLFERVRSAVVGSNRRSVAAAAARARELGYRALVLEEPLQGEAREAQARFRPGGPGHEPARPGQAIALLAGGETTVTVRGPGKGGRNQELALSLALAFESSPPAPSWAFLSAGTDGIDGPTDAAGGLVDGTTPARIRAAGLDPRSALEANDAYRALATAGDLVITGPTGTNVADISVLLARPG